MLAAMSYLIEVPGRFARGPAFLDIESRKVPVSSDLTPDGYIMKNGELLRTRWQAFLIGLAVDGKIWILDDEPENALLVHAGAILYWTDTIVYGATRQFDEMILKGKFTNARRAHEDHQFYPAMPGAEAKTWDCRKHGARIERVGDLPSKGISRVWERPERMPVLVHNLRDVAELVLQYGEPDGMAHSYLWTMMRSYEFAANRIRYAKRVVAPTKVA